MQFFASPNFNARALPVQHLILHYTGMRDADTAIARLCDPAAKVSAHYVVKENGDIIQLVEESQRAWHAGKSFWGGVTDLNSSSIGIEICNPGHEFGYANFPDAQILSVINLCKDILLRHDILSQNVLAHSDIAPTRKMDPGELFPWSVLAVHHVGLFPSSFSTQASGETSLATYGYDINDLPAAITAFQRHFRPEKINGLWDDDCAARLAWLLSQMT
jgi:N-acetylmuramoyl-L-alanine amidase